MKIRGAVSVLLVIGLVVSGCGPVLELGRLTVRFSLGPSKAILYDFSRVTHGSVVLSKDGSVVQEQPLVLDLPSRSGSTTLSGIIPDTYQLSIDLQDSSHHILYTGTLTNLVVLSGENQPASISLVRNAGKLTLSGSWTEAVAGLDRGTLVLKQAGEVKYATNLVVDADAQSVTGGIDNIYPGTYLLQVAMGTGGDPWLFRGEDEVNITAGQPYVATVDLVIQTGVLGITVEAGDVDAPEFILGPTVTVSGCDVTISWTTDENATGNVCYSTESGFDYETSTDWTPIGRDLTADSSSHSVTIGGLTEGATYYYVAVSADAAGNMVVSSEASFRVVELVPMVSVPSGTFPMGWEGIAEPVHSVTLSAFRMGRYEVTYEQWYLVKMWAGSRGYIFANAGREGADGSDEAPPTTAKTEPVIWVNWRDAVAWCNAYSEMLGLTPSYYNAGQAHTTPNVYRNAMTGGDISSGDVEWTASGYRLPTEAEWEYAARYVDGTSYTRGDFVSGATGALQEGVYAWYGDNSGSHTHPVGTKAANQLGIYDMSGNVSEWCWDWLEPYASGSQTNPRGASSGSYRMYRGGCWISDAALERSAYRSVDDPAYRNIFLGFRLVRSI